MKRIDYTNEIIGNRQIVRNYCINSDWTRLGLQVPTNASKYRLGKCLVCNETMPVDVKILKRFPPKRCAFCSNIGSKSTLPIRTNTWAIHEDYAVLNILYNNTIVSAYVDVEDVSKCQSKSWRVSKKRNKFYAVSGSKKNGMIYLHQFIFGKPKEIGLEIDHIDGNSLNNRKANLRYLPRSENARLTSVRIDNEIGIRGVSYNKKGKVYQSDFIYDHKRFFFKNWKTIEEAIWCRYCCEQAFGMTTLINNPLFEQYNNLSLQEKNKISFYVSEKIKEKSTV